jgi:ribosome-associated protein
MISQPDSSLVMPSKDKSIALLRAALTKKALNPVLLKLDKVTPITDYFLIVSAGSAKQVQAVADAVEDEARGRGFKRLSSEGVQQGNWALLDYADVIVHIFQPSIREFYDLEGLWSEAPRETLPEDVLQEVEAARVANEDDLDYFL